MVGPSCEYWKFWQPYIKCIIIAEALELTFVPVWIKLCRYRPTAFSSGFNLHFINPIWLCIPSELQLKYYTLYSHKSHICRTNVVWRTIMILTNDNWSYIRAFLCTFILMQVLPTSINAAKWILTQVYVSLLMFFYYHILFWAGEIWKTPDSSLVHNEPYQAITAPFIRLITGVVWLLCSSPSIRVSEAREPKDTLGMLSSLCSPGLRD